MLLAAKGRFETGPAAKPRNRGEAFRVARHQHQQVIRETVFKFSARGKHKILLTFVGAGGDPYRPVAAPTAAQHLRGFAQAGRQFDLELDASGDMNRIGRRAERLQTLRIRLRLRRQQLDLAQGGTRKSGKSFVLAHG